MYSYIFYGIDFGRGYPISQGSVRLFWSFWSLLCRALFLWISLVSRFDTLLPSVSDTIPWCSRPAQFTTRHTISISFNVSGHNNAPCGYRAHMPLHLAQERLGKAGLFDKIVLANSNMKLARDGDGFTICVPASVECRGGLVMRPKETDLVALLQAGTIDYLLIYRSVAVQHGLKFLDLPDEINLSNPEMGDCYRAVRVRLLADVPERSVEVRGKAIVYGITVPSAAREPELAMGFVRLLQSEEGTRILKECGQEPVAPGTYSRAMKLSPSSSP